MSWIKFVAGLVLFDLIVIMIISGFALSGQTVGTSTLDLTSPNMTTTTDIDSDSADTFFGSFVFTVRNMPWWINTFLVTYNLALVAILILAFVRGVT